MWFITYFRVIILYDVYLFWLVIKEIILVAKAISCIKLGPSPKIKLILPCHTWFANIVKTNLELFAIRFQNIGIGLKRIKQGERGANYMTIRNRFFFEKYNANLVIWTRLILQLSDSVISYDLWVMTHYSIQISERST